MTPSPYFMPSGYIIERFLVGRLVYAEDPVTLVVAASTAIGLRSGAPVIATAPIAIVPAHTEPPPSLGRQTPTCACQPRTIDPYNRPYARDAILATTLARSATIYA